MQFTLEQQAKKTGSDKYVCDANSSFNMYIPQNISRNEDKVHQKLTINIDPVIGDNISPNIFTLVQKAKSSGGDKYACVSNSTFIVYIPQSISRNGEDVYPKLLIEISI